MSGASGSWCENPCAGCNIPVIGSRDWQVTQDPETYVDSNGQTIADFVNLGLSDSLYSHTFGTLWSAATGTVDQTSKDQHIKDETIGLMKASGYGMTWANAYAQATSDVTGVLKQAKADPSQASLGNNVGLDNLKKYLEIGAVIILVIVAVDVYLQFKEI